MIVNCQSLPLVLTIFIARFEYILYAYKFGIVNFFFWLCLQLVVILVPWPGIEPGPSVVKEQKSNHWTAREFPGIVKSYWRLWIRNMKCPSLYLEVFLDCVCVIYILPSFYFHFLDSRLPAKYMLDFCKSSMVSWKEYILLC